MPEQGFLAFPDDFIWGVASSAYQIEGAADEDGRGLSIWDTFCHKPGAVYKGHTGDVAADHYHRFAEDVDLIASLGMHAYRFSIAWPRILPEGRGSINQKGIDFYNRLVDVLLERDIIPMPTLYHWDLPQALQDTGGWKKRDTAKHFADYAQVMVEALGDRVTRWITHNEPFVVAVLGHFTGEHAPGIQDPFATFHTAYHVLLSHGLAVEAMRAAAPQPLQIGITLDYNPIHPASEREEDLAAARRFDGVRNRLYFEPVFLGRFPEDMIRLFGALAPEVRPDDLAMMNTPIEFLGVNYYTRMVVRHDSSTPLIEAVEIQPQGREYSMMWEIYPEGLHEMLMRIWRDYQPPAIYITENGIPVPDDLDHDGKVRDYRRIRYLRDHLIQAHRAIQSGVPLKGYLHWSILDNFEWALGYRMRFGLVYVDFETLERTVKMSGHWFAQVVRRNGLAPAERAPFLPE